MPHTASRENLGPQRSADAPFARRVRFHQSWYRVVVLGRDAFGNSPGRASRPLGSALAPVDAEAGLNFTSSSARYLYASRRLGGWGVDPTRCTSLMTSSQAMMFNLFGPLAADRGWLLRTLMILLSRTNLVEVVAIEPEFAPTHRSEHLGDQTRIDMLLVVRSGAGDEVLAIELKYMDRFSSRQVNTSREPYRRIARDVNLWSDPTFVLGSHTFNQLVRVHALAVSVGLGRGSHVPVTLMTIGHRADAKTWSTLDAYRTQLTASERMVMATLDELLNAMSAATIDSLQLRETDDLRRRYVNEHESGEAWSRFGGSSG
ncbi:hypothetical protein [Actinoplanes sp. NPDC049802]|uniref:PGN_0703 family putative restriction endonuclease n=1 Tax=Actinoplanes sp. NPDC049802 TaxID=3154742 RepID=UPI0034092A58